MHFELVDLPFPLFWKKICSFGLNNEIPSTFKHLAAVGTRREKGMNTMGEKGYNADDNSITMRVA